MYAIFEAYVRGAQELLNKGIYSISLFGSIYAGPGDASSDEREEIVRARLITPFDKLIKQESSSILVEIDINNSWHINSDQPLEEFLIPTKVSFEKTKIDSPKKIMRYKPRPVVRVVQTYITEHSPQMKKKACFSISTLLHI